MSNIVRPPSMNRRRANDDVVGVRSPLWNPITGDEVEAVDRYYGRHLLMRGVVARDEDVVVYETRSGAERCCTIEDWRRWCAETRVRVVSWGAR